MKKQKQEPTFSTILSQEIAHFKTIHTALKTELRKNIALFLIEEGRSSVTEIIIHFRDKEQSVISQQLAYLRRAGLASADRDGKNIYYTFNDDYYNLIQELAREAFSALPVPFKR